MLSPPLSEIGSSKTQLHRTGPTSPFQNRRLLVLRRRLHRQISPDRRHQGKHFYYSSSISMNSPLSSSSSKASPASSSSIYSGIVPSELCTPLVPINASPYMDNNSIPLHTPPLCPQLPPLSVYECCNSVSPFPPPSLSPISRNYSSEIKQFTVSYRNCNR
uniref:Putative ovule protein n=1 Tax=Solanum chacoense TaxID=4108 RepID=A0A0V0HKW5_SOLCH